MLVDPVPHRNCGRAHRLRWWRTGKVLSQTFQNSLYPCVMNWDNSQQVSKEHSVKNYEAYQAPIDLSGDVEQSLQFVVLELIDGVNDSGSRRKDRQLQRGREAEMDLVVQISLSTRLSSTLRTCLEFPLDPDPEISGNRC